MQLVDAIFDGGAGEDKGVAAAEAFDGLGGLGAPVLDALGFVEHDNVWTEAGVHVERVPEQRAFGKGQVQHALALVGKERNFGFVHGPFAALHLISSVSVVRQSCGDGILMSLVFCAVVAMRR